MSKLVKVDVDFEALNNLDTFIQRHGDRISKVMAATVQTNRGLLFSHEGAYNGHQSWEKPKMRHGQALQDTGALRNSISPKSRNGALVPNTPGKGGYINYSGYDVKDVELGTELHYAKIHTTGGKITAKNAKALKIPIGKGESAKFTEKRFKKLHEEIAKEKTPKRRASLQRRIDDVQAILWESKGSNSKKKRKAYLKKIADKLTGVKGSERRKLVKLANRVVRTSDQGKFIFRKSVTIPKRDWSEWNAADQNEFQETLTNFVAHLLGVELGG